MKKIILAVTILAAAAMNTPTARAGESGWATAGKVLTGVAAADILAHALDSHVHVGVNIGGPACCAPAPVVYAPPRVIVREPAPWFYRGPYFAYRDYGFREHREFRRDRDDFRDHRDFRHDRDDHRGGRGDDHRGGDYNNHRR